MKKRIIALVISSLSLVPFAVGAQALAENAPTTYTVVKGDTLWGIAGKFLKEPWRWPEVWNMNREQIKDPHWIYPGDVVRLDYTTEGKPRLSLDGSTLSGSVGADGSVKVVPRVRVEPLAQAIPSIPGTAIGPFLTSPLVEDAAGMTSAPKIVATEESRVIIGTGNIAYVDSIDANAGVRWQLYRPGVALTDPDTKEILGYEATYLGDARVTRFGIPATIEVLRAVQEINTGDRLSPARDAAMPSYSPHAPDKKIQGKIIAVKNGVSEGAQWSIVALNRGKRDGLEIGHVLATYRAGEMVAINDSGGGFSTSGVRSFLEGIGGRWFGLNAKPNPVVADAAPAATTSQTAAVAAAKTATEVRLPDERNGLVFVFRVFDRLSYALVMQSKRPIYLYDVVQTP